MNTRGFHRPRIVRSAMAALLLTVATFGAARAADVHNLGRFTLAPIKSAPATTTLPPFNLTTAKSVDERLFILRVCNEIVGQLPAPNERSGELKAELNWATQIATEFQTYAQSRHMDPLIINQFAGVIQMVDAYRRLMAGINEINAAAGRDSSNTVLDSISGGAQVAGKVHEAAKAKDATDRQADTFGVIIGLVAGIVNAENKSEQINADKREALDAEDREFEKELSRFYGGQCGCCRWALHEIWVVAHGCPVRCQQFAFSEVG